MKHIVTSFLGVGWCVETWTETEDEIITKKRLLREGGSSGGVFLAENNEDYLTAAWKEIKAALSAGIPVYFSNHEYEAGIEIVNMLPIIEAFLMVSQIITCLA